MKIHRSKRRRLIGHAHFPLSAFRPINLQRAERFSLAARISNMSLYPNCSRISFFQHFTVIYHQPNHQMLLKGRASSYIIFIFFCVYLYPCKISVCGFQKHSAELHHYSRESSVMLHELICVGVVQGLAMRSILKYERIFIA